MRNTNGPGGQKPFRGQLPPTFLAYENSQFSKSRKNWTLKLGIYESALFSIYFIS